MLSDADTKDNLTVTLLSTPTAPPLTVHRPLVRVKVPWASDNFTYQLTDASGATSNAVRVHLRPRQQCQS